MIDRARIQALHILTTRLYPCVNYSMIFQFSASDPGFGGSRNLLTSQQKCATTFTAPGMFTRSACGNCNRDTARERAIAFSNWGEEAAQCDFGRPDEAIAVTLTPILIHMEC